MSEQTEYDRILHAAEQKVFEINKQRAADPLTHSNDRDVSVGRNLYYDKLIQQVKTDAQIAANKTWGVNTS